MTMLESIQLVPAAEVHGQHQGLPELEVRRPICGKPLGTAAWVLNEDVPGTSPR
jgi:hypothetical protein